MNLNYKKLGSGELVTAWSDWKRTKLFAPKLKGEMISVPVKESKRGFVNVYFSRNSTSAPKPLIIYFPGVFGEVGDRLTEEFVQRLESLDTHVVVIPNLLSSGWIQGQPKYEENPIRTELSIMSQIGKLINAHFPLIFISNTYIIGEGMGGILATAWSAQTEFTPRPKNVTLLWPATKMNKAIENLDSYLLSSAKDSENCFWTFPLFLRYFVLSDTPNGISEENGKCLSAWGAHKSIMKNLHKISTINSEVSGNKLTRPQSFNLFLEHSYRPLWLAMKNEEPMMNLSYWIKMITDKQPLLNLRILTSYDDFHNRQAPIAEMALINGFETSSVSVMDWGGHGGPMATPEFQEFLQNEFGQ